MASVEFQNVTKTFGGFTAAKDLNLEIGDGEFVCLLGPSGCGKTTSLRMIAGLETPTSGRIRIAGEDVTNLHPKDRQISMVFQDYALYPHMTIADNIAYPLKVRGETQEKRHARAQEVADVLKIGDLLARLPSQISGGQQQRTSLARALVYPSRVYLFDEPLSNLDAKLRLEARGFLNHLQRDMGMTAVYVTHDQAEAMALATRSRGDGQGPHRAIRAADRDLPPPRHHLRRQLRRQPADEPPAGRGARRGRPAAPQRRRPRRRDPACAAAAGSVPGQHLTLGVRPEHLSVGDAGPNTIRGKLFANENMGPEKLVTVERPDAARFTARIFTDDLIALGDDVTLSFDTRHITLFDADGRRIPGAGEGA